MPHGYTNDTRGDGAFVVKTYVGPSVAARHDRERTILERLHALLPIAAVVPDGLDFTADRIPERPPGGETHRLRMPHLPGVQGQELIDAGFAGPVLRSCGATLRQLQSIPLSLAAPDVEHFSGAVLVHGDYGPNNMLFDPRTVAVTGLLDWEWAHVGRSIEDLAWCEWIVRMQHPGHVAALRRRHRAVAAANPRDRVPVGVTSSRPSYAMSPVAVSGSHSRTQLSEPVDAVGLIGDAVAPDASAPQTSMHDHVSLGRMVVERYRRHQTVARIRAVAGQDVDMEREQAVRAVVAVAAAGERRDGHAAVGTDERRVLGGSGDGRSSRVEVIFKLERPRVPSALARDRRITAARARRLGWRVTDSPPASRASDYFQFLLHPGLLHPEIRTPAGFVSSLICFRPRFWASHCQEGSPACHR